MHVPLYLAKLTERTHLGKSIRASSNYELSFSETQESK